MLQDSDLCSFENKKVCSASWLEESRIHDPFLGSVIKEIEYQCKYSQGNAMRIYLFTMLVV
jgi:hypothetical protein